MLGLGWRSGASSAPVPPHAGAPHRVSHADRPSRRPAPRAPSAGCVVSAFLPSLWDIPIMERPGALSTPPRATVLRPAEPLPGEEQTAGPGQAARAVLESASLLRLRTLAVWAARAPAGFGFSCRSLAVGEAVLGCRARSSEGLARAGGGSGCRPPHCCSQEGRGCWIGLLVRTGAQGSSVSAVWAPSHCLGPELSPRFCPWQEVGPEARG